MMPSVRLIYSLSHTDGRTPTYVIPKTSQTDRRTVTD